jgi:hypothetical protein
MPKGNEGEDKMICEKCKKEIGVGETLKIKELGLEVTKVQQHNTAFKDIVIPKGWDIPTVQQGIDLVNNEKFCEFTKFMNENNDFFAKQPFKCNEPYVARFLAYSGRVALYCNWSRDLSVARLGVLLVRKI